MNEKYDRKAVSMIENLANILRTKTLFEDNNLNNLIENVILLSEKAHQKSTPLGGQIFEKLKIVAPNKANNEFFNLKYGIDGHYEFFNLKNGIDEQLAYISVSLKTFDLRVEVNLDSVTTDKLILVDPSGMKEILNEAVNAYSFSDILFSFGKINRKSKEKLKEELISAVSELLMAYIDQFIYKLDVSLYSDDDKEKFVREVFNYKCFNEQNFCFLTLKSLNHSGVLPLYTTVQTVEFITGEYYKTIFGTENYHCFIEQFSGSAPLWLLNNYFNYSYDKLSPNYKQKLLDNLVTSIKLLDVNEDDLLSTVRGFDFLMRIAMLENSPINKDIDQDFYYNNVVPELKSATKHLVVQNFDRFLLDQSSNAFDSILNSYNQIAPKDERLYLEDFEHCLIYLGRELF